MSLIYEPKGRAAEYGYLAINHYEPHCPHSCRYCYVPGLIRMSPAEFHADSRPRAGLEYMLRQECPKYQWTNKRVFLSFTSDPYQPVEAKYLATRMVLKSLRCYQIPFTVLTKGGVLAQRDFDLYGPYDSFGVTLTTTSDFKAQKWEPKAAPPTFRIESLKIAKRKFRIETWVSLEPVLDPVESLKVIEQTSEFVDLYRIGKLNYQESATDWRAFGVAAIDLCNKLSANYFIKSDLEKHLTGIPFCNNERRIVSRKEPSKCLFDDCMAKTL